MKSLSFRVKTFGGDVMIIEEHEYSKTVRAQLKKTVVLLDGYGSISGGSIESVKPDWHGELDYHDYYELKGGDLDEIPRARRKEYLDFMKNENEQITNLLSGQKIPQLG